MKIFRTGVVLFFILYWMGMSKLWLRFIENNRDMEGFTLNLCMVTFLGVVTFPFILGSVKGILSFTLPKGFAYYYYVEGHWYSGAWRHNGRDDGLLPKEGEVAFNYQDSHMINKLVPAYVSEGKVGLYKIARGPYRKIGHFGSDRAGCDDNNYVDLRLVDIRPLHEIENILKKQVS